MIDTYVLVYRNKDLERLETQIKFFIIIIIIITIITSIVGRQNKDAVARDIKNEDLKQYSFSLTKTE